MKLLLKTQITQSKRVTAIKEYQPFRIYPIFNYHVALIQFRVVLNPLSCVIHLDKSDIHRQTRLKTVKNGYK